MATATDNTEDQEIHALANFLRAQIQRYRAVHGKQPAAEFAALFTVGDEILSGNFKSTEGVEE